MDFAKTLEAVQALSDKWPQATLKLVEDKANGPAVISALRLKVRGLLPVKPQGGKLSRAQAILPLVAAGNVWLPNPQEQPWVEHFLAEASAFPVGAHDDQVDAMSQGLQRFLTAKDTPAEVDPLTLHPRSMLRLIAEQRILDRQERAAAGYYRMDYGNHDDDLW